MVWGVGVAKALWHYGTMALWHYVACVAGVLRGGCGGEKKRIREKTRRGEGGGGKKERLL